MNNSKAKVILIFAILLLLSCLVVSVFFGNSQKHKHLFIFQKYYLKRNLVIPKNYNGLWREWDKKGNLLTISEVKNGLINGEKKSFDPHTGILVGRSNYINGKLFGKQEVYFNGKLDSLRIWDIGHQNIQIIWYYDNGNEYINCFYQNNSINGEFNCFYESGNKKLKGTILNNRPINEWFYFEDNKDATKVILNATNAEDLNLIERLIIGNRSRFDFDLIKLFDKDGFEVRKRLSKF